MVLTLQKITEDARTAVKHPTTIKTLTGRPTNDINIISPYFVVEYDVNLIPCNYAYITDFGRSYFVQIELLTPTSIGINCNADDLSNWYNYYQNKNAIIMRSESIAQPTDIPDKELPINPNMLDVETKLFPNTPFSDDLTNSRCWLLTTLSGQVIE